MISGRIRAIWARVRGLASQVPQGPRALSPLGQFSVGDELRPHADVRPTRDDRDARDDRGFASARDLETLPAVGRTKPNRIQAMLQNLTRAGSATWAQVSSLASQGPRAASRFDEGPAWSWLRGLSIAACFVSLSVAIGAHFADDASLAASAGTALFFAWAVAWLAETRVKP